VAKDPHASGRFTVGPEETIQDISLGTRTLVIGPYLTSRAAARRAATGTPESNTRDFEARIEEAAGLAAAIDIDLVSSMVIPIGAPRPATFIGTGKIDELHEYVENENITLVVVDCALSPVQQRNLERALKVKVIDRTGLILEIFGRRARTKEGTLQVELAHLSYQKSRLVRSWTHLERQRGGFGFLGGPGETQIEADRRLIQERMMKIEKDLESVKRTRGLHRKGRDRAPYPIVALVGYTNAGKSTLFNRLTSAEVLAENMLFATLDPTARVTKLPHGAPIILSDTVGFISDLPTMLVAAFRATLEDVISADVILHVRDVSHGDTEAQAADVVNILRDLGVDPDDHGRLIEVWNKADLLTGNERDRLSSLAEIRPFAEKPVLVSAITGDGILDLMTLIEKRVARASIVYSVSLGPTDGARMNWLYEDAEVLERRMTEEGGYRIAVRVLPEKESRLLRRFPDARLMRKEGH
jgi:GTP-binding protein HflX